MIGLNLDQIPVDVFWMMWDNIFTTTRLFIGETYSMETPAFATGILCDDEKLTDADFYFMLRRRSCSIASSVEITTGPVNIGISSASIIGTPLSNTIVVSC